MYNSKEIRKTILSHFYSLKDCAAKMGIKPSSLTTLLRKPSLRFIDRLREVGVVFPDDDKHKFIKSINDTDNIDNKYHEFNDYSVAIQENLAKIQRLFVEMVKENEFLRKRNNNLENDYEICTMVNKSLRERLEEQEQEKKKLEISTVSPKKEDQE